MKAKDKKKKKQRIAHLNNLQNREWEGWQKNKHYLDLQKSGSCGETLSRPEGKWHIEDLSFYESKLFTTQFNFRYSKGYNDSMSLNTSRKLHASQTV